MDARNRALALRCTVMVATIVILAVALCSAEALGPTMMLQLLERVGWMGFTAYLAYSLVVFVLLGAAWLVVMGEGWRLLSAFVWARMLREAASDLLPLSQVGGIVIGADTLIARGLPGAFVYAAITADLSTEMVSQALFTLLAIGVFTTTSTGDADPSLKSAITLCVVAIVLIAVVARSAPLWIPKVAPRIIGWVMPRSLDIVNDMADRLRRIYAKHSRIATSTAINFLAWSMSAAGAWIVLRLMGSRLSLNRTLCMESFIFALRSVAFTVPAGLVVQEAGYVLSASAFGLPLEFAVMLAIAKRCRDLAIGLPTLLVWQAGEMRRLGAPLMRDVQARLAGKSGR